MAVKFYKPAGEEYQREGNCNRHTKSKLNELQNWGVRKRCQDVTSKVCVAKCNVAKEPNGDVDSSAKIYSSFHNLIHLGWSCIG